MTPSNDTKQVSLIGFVIGLSGALLFSTKAIFVKLAFQDTHTNAIDLLFLRMLFSLPFYLIIGWVVLRKEGNVNLTKQQWIYTLVLGIAGYYLSSLFDFIGLQYISAGLERLILFLYPTFSILLNAIIFKERITRMQMLALLLTYSGIGLAYFGELKIDNSNPMFLFGTTMILLCSITYSFYLVGTGKLVGQIGSTRYTTYAMLSATIGVFLHYLISHSASSTPSIVWNPTLLAYSAALAILATVVPSFLISNAMKRIGSNNVSIITSIGPVSTILQAHFILGEQIFSEQLIGTMLVLAGVLLIGWKAQTKKVIEA